MSNPNHDQQLICVNEEEEKKELSPEEQHASDVDTIGTILHGKKNLYKNLLSKASRDRVPSAEEKQDHALWESRLSTIEGFLMRLRLLKRPFAFDDFKQLIIDYCRYVRETTQGSTKGKDYTPQFDCVKDFGLYNICNGVEQP